MKDEDATWLYRQRVSTVKPCSWPQRYERGESLPYRVERLKERVSRLQGMRDGILLHAGEVQGSKPALEC
jgi:hypothetical protein